MIARSLIHDLYNTLPHAAQQVVAGARGLHLRRWRYGPETEGLVPEALARETWGREKWIAWSEERLAFVLERAATRVPYYRDYWEARPNGAGTPGWKDLTRWPVLEKEALRRNSIGFIAEDRKPGAMFHEHTSGTTGKPLDLWWSKETVRAWYALFEARVRRWHGVSRNSRWANVGGQLVVPASRRRPPFWVWNGALNQLYMSSYHLAPELIPHYLEALRGHQVEYLFGYSSSLHSLALGVLASGRREWPMKVAITNAEPLFPHQRAAIGEAFQCPVRATYGMAEIVVTASECGSGRLHLWPEVGRLEVLRQGDPVPTGEPGEFISTGLFNADMPLIRYRTGDRGALSGGEAPCPCGRSLPLLKEVEGRSDDVLFTRDGRRIGRLDPVFKARLPIAEAQIVQESLEQIRVRLVPLEGWGARAEEDLTAKLRERLGDVVVLFDLVESVPRQPNGKFRAVICALPKALVAELEARAEGFKT